MVQRWAVRVVLIASSMTACKTIQSRPLDIVGGSTVDANGLLVNPHWAGQIAGKPVDPTICSPSGSAQDNPANWNTGNNACTTYAVKTERGKGCGPHVNWFPIQYSGIIEWDSHSAPGTDDDYNVELKRDDQAMYTSANSSTIHCEFDSDETVDHFTTPWWVSFKNTVNGGDQGAKAMINNKQAIVIGLAGLDCAGHEPGKNICYTELHPVYALAIHVNDDPGHERWAFFIRNRGDEGWCSSNEQKWTPSRYTNGKGEYHIMLPAPNARTFITRSGNVKIYGAGNSRPPGADEYTAKLVPGQGLDVTVLLPDPASVGDADDWIVEGDIDVIFR
jgi:hypothetical protein